MALQYWKVSYDQIDMDERDFQNVCNNHKDEFVFSRKWCGFGRVRASRIPLEETKDWKPEQECSTCLIELDSWGILPKQE